MLNLLIIDDSVPFLNDVELLLKDKYKIFKAENGRKGINIIKKENVSVLLLDLKLPDIDGLDILRLAHSEIDPNLPIIIVTDFGDIDTVVKAMSLGAADFIQKDFNIALLHQKIIASLKKRELNIELKTLKDSLDRQYDYFICTSKAMQRVENEITKIARLNADVLLFGETGVGKDVVAYEIHKRSQRKDKLFIEVSLNALSDSLIESELFGYEKGAFSGADSTKMGKFEAANGGTIYLPEIADISEKIQVKLLSFMQYKEISKVGPGNAKKVKLDVRIIMATNKELLPLVKSNRLREDFYYRINVLNIHIPPLRERKDGILNLANYFLNIISLKHNKKGLSFSDDLFEAMKRHDWRGNIRELKNAIESAIVMTDNDTILTLNDFPNLVAPLRQYAGNDGSFQSAMHKAKYEYFTSLLAETNGNKTQAAERAGLSRQGLLKILKELGIERSIT